MRAAAALSRSAASAVASFEKLLAMHQDCLAMQASMGEELAKLAASLGKSGARSSIGGGFRMQTFTTGRAAGRPRLGAGSGST